MNILVVDDEYYIVKNIIEHTDWGTLGIEKQFPAYSARQAKQILEGTDDIDILLTDIEMPRESGLELVSWMKENGFSPTILVLTGHQRFDYAQTALNLHIFSYILKPVDAENLNEELKKAVKNVRRTRILQKESIAIEEQLARQEQTPTDLVSAIKECVKRNLSSPDLNRNMIAEEIHINMDYMSHQFHKKAGISLSNYIIEERMHEARRLLVTTDYSLQQISDKTGFSNISYFHRQFKKISGVTPQQYRTDHR